MRRATHHVFQVMCAMMWSTGQVKIEISRQDREKLKKLRSCIIVANHPSLIDICLLIGFLPQADCIVNAALFEMPIVRLVVRRLFIPNSMDFGEILSLCEKSLNDGNCLVIFPEGSRTKPGQKSVIHKGSARISLGTGRPTLPIHIEANDMRGLRKKDPFWRIKENGPYSFHFMIQTPILSEAYASMPIPVAARKMTADIGRGIFPYGQGESEPVSSET